ncbi:MAG: VOC family protein [Christensenellales bacterium]
MEHPQDQGVVRPQGPRFTFAHNNFNVVDLERSLRFYHEALGLKELRRKESADFTLVFLGDGAGAHQLELTWIKGFKKPAYDLGDNEFHLAFIVDDFEAAHALHKEMGCICFENEAMGLYFIADPDGYWLEIIPRK